MPPFFGLRLPANNQAQLDRIEAALKTVTAGLLAQTAILLAIQKQETILAATIASLQAEVTKQTGVINSATTLLNGISAQLKTALAQEDPAAIQSVIDQIDANTAALAAAVTANTPAASSPAE
jgi:hypothetical protein